MRPRVLTVSAFGPYPGTEIVDFRAFAGMDLVLIDGPTGAGKTALLDAMTYALYGVVPGARAQVKDEELRSRWAEASARCEVKLEFELGERVWRVERAPAQRRQKKRGSGTTEERADARLFEVTGAGDRPAAAGRVADVTAAVEGLLGLTAEQFIQVLVLPQGEFRKLLLAPSPEKEALLERLFAAEIYKEVARLLAQDRTDLERRRSELAGVCGALLDQRGLASAAELGERVAEARARVTAVGDEVERASAIARAAQQRHREALRMADWLVQRDRLRAELERLGADAPAMEEGRGVMARAERAAPLAEARAHAEAAAAERGRRRIEAEERGAARAAAAEELERCRTAAAAVPALKAQIDAWTVEETQLRGLAVVEREAQVAVKEADAAAESAARLAAAERSLRDERDALATARQAAEQAAAALDAVEARARQAAEILERRRAWTLAEAGRLAAAKAVAKARVAAEAAREALDAGRRAREAGLAAEIAGRLQTGEPCPVCGGTEHPAPARPHGRVVPDVAALERADAAAARRRTEAERDEASRQAALEAVAVQGDAAPADENELASRARTAQAEADAARRAAAAAPGARLAHEAAEKQLEPAADAAAQAREALAAAGARRDERWGRLTQAGGAGFAERAVVVADRREGAERRLRLVQDKLAWAEAALTAADRAAADAARVEEESARHLDERTAELEHAARRLEFADAAEAARAHLPAGRLHELRRRIADWDRSRAVAGDRLAAVEAELARADGVAELDVPALAAQSAEAETNARTAQERLGEARNQLEELVRTAEAVAERAREQAAVEEDLRVRGHLARVVGGENARRMSLARWVLANRMEDIALAASVRLLDMSRGRYALRRADAVYDARRGGGLDLMVEDRHTGVDRPVHTLSGGEMFMCSLSLAMGLADSVQSHAGGVRLDSLFIDEGFGTLDDDTLDQVIRTLEDLRVGGRLVGLISHVAELRERLPARISVRKGARGSCLAS